MRTHLKKVLWTSLGLFVLVLATAHLFAQTLGTWTYIPEGTCPSAGTASASLLCSNSADHALTFSFNAGGLQNIGQTFYSTGTYSNASTTLSSIDGLSWPVSASRKYHADCNLIWSTTNNSGGPKYQFTGPGNPFTSVGSALISSVTVASFASAAVNSYSTVMANTGTVTPGLLLSDRLTFNLVNGSAANGTVQLQAAANGTGTITFLQGSSCTVQ